MELSPQIVTILMLGGVLVGILIGYHIAIPVGTVALIVGYVVMGGAVGDLLYTRLFALIHNYVLLAVPLFVFMGFMLERTGVAEGLYGALYLWLGRLKGGLALSTVIIGTILAACVGIIGASVTMLAIIALPAMLTRNYDKSLAAGSVCAGGTLGILIPPSVMLVVYGPVAQLSVGKLFMAAIPAGLVLSGLYCIYIGVRCLFQPEIGPAVPAAETAIPLSKKTYILVTQLLPTAVLIVAVLGSIFFGIAAPTEAAAVGAFVATLLAVVYRKFSWHALREVTRETFMITSMILLIGGLSYAFTGVFLSAGCGHVVEDFILGAPFGRWGAFAVIMLIVFVLGMFIDWQGIVFIMVPILTPIGPALGFDPLWFAMMVIVNLQMSFMTPPFAYAIFYVKGSLPQGVELSTAEIIRGVLPFTALIVVGIALFIAFPQIILWLPNLMIK